MPMLEVNHLKKYFQLNKRSTLKAVDDISFAIEKGKTMGLVGESGCGKTTVGRTIVRLYDADAGEVRFEGEDVLRADKKAMRLLNRRMQMIFQDPYASLNPRFMVGSIVAEGLDLNHLCKSRAERNGRMLSLLEMVGLSKEHASRFPHEFSGGQRQRVGIARALAMNPEFIICDEAISALDVSIQAQIINLLVRLQEEMGLTYLFIAHDLAMVRHISDHTAVMYLGVIMEMGPTEDVYKNPLHPYTQGLLSAVVTPDPDYERGRQRIMLSGDVPSPVNPVPGCRFCARCKHAKPICAKEAPVLSDMGGGHRVACHLYS